MAEPDKPEPTIQDVREAIARTCDDIAKVELRAATLRGFSRPIPAYDVHALLLPAA